MIVENTKQDQIKNVIIKVASATYGIKPEHIRKAIEKYIYDERDIEVIEQELWTYSKEIEKEARLREQNVNDGPEQSVNKNYKQSYETTDVDKESTDNYLNEGRQERTEESVNLQETTSYDSQDELSAMFSDAPVKREPSKTHQQQAEKGRVLVKTPVSNNRGQATFLNLCFVFSTIAILGMIISTVILHVQKIFN